MKKKINLSLISDLINKMATLTDYQYLKNDYTNVNRCNSFDISFTLFQNKLSARLL